ncbi:TerB family tellurite resistance protein [Flavobacterium collinsii]|jgi:DNA repair ATPase RecN|uniref:Type IV secretory system conjugative DNA transfer TraI family protein n=1 Tax=Flavobacterium collinsii TaxID=1114861 RepID=A0A9W4X4M6_9FLAO|nr:TerB family tellurite resistance protein [Flavobacterium collinsii]CAI2768633.1 Type IV secretory system conjugative DNA transfer TraI family protein [Flavobacterium collinsii]
MKKILILGLLICLSMIPSKARAQSAEIQQLILNIEKLSQFKKILSNMKKGYELLSGGYKTVKDMSQGNFSLHKTFLDALMQVSPAVKNYKRVGEIVNFQILLVKESRNGLNRFARNGSFSPQEIGYFEKVYANLLSQSLRNLDELTMIVTADKLRMSDDERLQAVDMIYLQMQDKLLFLRNFNASSNILALQRAKEKNDVYASKELQELKN